MATRIQLRGDTAINWFTVNPTLGEREFAIETDTYKIKLGNGITDWNNLDYLGFVNVVNYGNNRVILSDGTSGGLIATSGVTYDGNVLTLGGGAFYSFGTGWTQNQTVSYITGATGNVLVTKEWVESLSVDASTALAVNVATTAVLPACTYNNGTGGIGATLTRNTNGTLGTIDTVTSFGIGDRILVKNQASQIQNGVYEVTVVGSVSTPFVITRTIDSDQTSELDPQIVIPTRGTQAGLRFAQTTADPVVGTNNIVYVSVGNTSTFVTQNAAGTQTSGNIPFWTTTARDLNKGSNNQLFWDNTNKRLGIRNGSPTTTLDVSGKTKTITLQITSGATAGYVLTSTDSLGNALWSPVSALTNVVNSITTSTGLSANTSTGNVTLINTLPDQTVTISGGTGILTGGTYPNFTITNTAPDRTVTISGGTNISVTGTYPNFVVTNTAASNSFTGLSHTTIFSSTPQTINTTNFTQILTATTPEAGTWSLTAVVEGTNAANNSTFEIALFSGGTIIPNTTFLISQSAFRAPITTIAIVILNGTTSVDLRARVTTSSVGNNMQGYYFKLIKIA